MVKTGEPGTLRGDLDTVEESSFLVGFEVLSFVFPVSTLWRRAFCEENNSKKSEFVNHPHFITRVNDNVNVDSILH